MRTSKQWLCCICMIALFLLSACGSASEVAPQEPTSAPEVTTESSQIQEEPIQSDEEPIEEQPAEPLPNEESNTVVQRVQSNDFRATGSQQEKHENFNFSVPGAWAKKDKGNLTYYFYPSADGASILMVKYYDFQHEVSVNDSLMLKALMEGVLESENGQNPSDIALQATMKKVNYGYIEYDSVINDADYHLSTALFDYQKGVVEFTFADAIDEPMDFTSDYHRILESVEVNIDKSHGYVGEYYVAIDQYLMLENDRTGERAIIAQFDYTNYSDDTDSPLTSLSMRAYQDGIELERAFIYDVPEYDPGIIMKNVRPGATLTGCQVAYELISKSPVEFEIGTLYGKAKLLKVYD